MKRREFLGAWASGGSIAWAEGLPADLKITRAVGFDLYSRRSKVAGKNARKDVYGSGARDRIVAVYECGRGRARGGARRAGVGCHVSERLARTGRMAGERAVVRGPRRSSPHSRYDPDLTPIRERPPRRATYSLVAWVATSPAH